MKISVLIAALMALGVDASMRKHHHHHHKVQGKVPHKQNLYQSDFYKHRDMLNSNEFTNLEMFETLSSKLGDEQFINQAIENNQRLQLTNKDDYYYEEGYSNYTNNNSSDEFSSSPQAGPIMTNSTSHTNRILTK